MTEVVLISEMVFFFLNCLPIPESDTGQYLICLSGYPVMGKYGRLPKVFLLIFFGGGVTPFQQLRSSGPVKSDP